MTRSDRQLAGVCCWSGCACAAADGADYCAPHHARRREVAVTYADHVELKAEDQELLRYARARLVEQGRRVCREDLP